MAAKKAKQADTKNTAMISDVEKVFRYSGLSDKVRDAAGLLVQSEGAHSVRGEVAVPVRTYLWLRDQIAAHLRADLAEEMLLAAPVLDEETARIDEVFFAAEILSTYADLVYQTPKFLLSEQAQELGMREVRHKISKGVIALDEADDNDPLQVPMAGLGQYL